MIIHEFDKYSKSLKIDDNVVATLDGSTLRFLDEITEIRSSINGAASETLSFHANEIKDIDFNNVESIIMNVEFYLDTMSQLDFKKIKLITGTLIIALLKCDEIKFTSPIILHKDLYISKCACNIIDFSNVKFGFTFEMLTIRDCINLKKIIFPQSSIKFAWLLHLSSLKFIDFSNMTIKSLICDEELLKTKIRYTGKCVITDELNSFNEPPELKRILKGPIKL